MLPQTEAPAPRAAAGPRLLVVEDEVLIALELCHDLADLGWTILGPAISVLEATALLGAGPLPDAAVLDVNLGHELVYPLAETLEALGVPFVFCTAYEHLGQGGRFAGRPIVSKPVNLTRLDDVLRQVRRAA